MGVLYGIGKTLVTHDELIEKAAVGDLQSFAENVERGTPATIRMANVEISSEEIVASRRDVIPFEPIGMNKPLTIELISIYTGDAPERRWIDKVLGRNHPDLLVVSGAKTPTTFGAAPRAINQVIKDIEDKKHYRPGALREGAALIYHSPAMTEPTTYVSVEMVVDSYSGELLKVMENLFGSAAGLPVFAPAASYLLAGSTISKIAGELSKSLFETGPFLRADVDIRLDSPGFFPSLPRFLVLASDSDISKLENYTVQIVEEQGNPRVTLYDKESGNEYDGDVPFVIVSLDGRENQNENYQSFVPQHAAASMLEEFYGSDTVTGVTVALQDSMILYNDLRYRRAADRLKASLENVDKNSEEYQKIQERLNAYKTNIQTQEFKAGL